MKKSQKEEKELDLEEAVKNKTLNYGLMLIWIKVKYLMEMIQHMVMVL
jgi:hypothetical protein